MAFVIAGLAWLGLICTPAAAQSNPGFETGDLTGWTEDGSGFVFGTFRGVAPHSGDYQYVNGKVHGLGSLSQMFSTVPGATYDISFWLANGTGQTNEFIATFGNTQLIDLKNASQF